MVHEMHTVCSIYSEFKIVVEMNSISKLCFTLYYTLNFGMFLTQSYFIEIGNVTNVT